MAMKEETIALSVITPVYNGRDYIRQCIQNVIDQDCRFSEHVIVDGGSKDGTVESIEQYSKAHRNIRYVSEPDRGQSDAMNKGIGLARGTIIGILNVDDFYEPNVLNRVIELFRAECEPIVLVSNCKRYDSSGKYVGVEKPRSVKYEDLIIGSPHFPHPPNPSAYFYHKSIHDRIGLYDVEDHYAMDLDFILRAASGGFLKYVDETWGNFVMHAKTKTYLDFISGKSMERQRALLERHRRSMPWLRRLVCVFRTWRLGAKNGRL